MELPTKSRQEIIDWEQLKPGDLLVWWGPPNELIRLTGELKPDPSIIQSHIIAEFKSHHSAVPDVWIARIIHMTEAWYKKYDWAEDHIAEFSKKSYEKYPLAYWEPYPANTQRPRDRFSILDL